MGAEQDEKKNLTEEQLAALREIQSLEYFKPDTPTKEFKGYNPSEHVNETLGESKIKSCLRSFFEFVIGVICTPLAPISYIISAICKFAMYVGIIPFIFGAISIYTRMQKGSTFFGAIGAEWYLLIFPFAACILCYIFQSLGDLLKFNSII